VTAVCGIDVGSLRTPADVAWLDEGRFVLGRYTPSAAVPLPETPAGLPEPRCYALDAPQSLPAPGSTRRAADRAARTPTNVLPVRRADVAAMRAYGPFVEAGLTLFWEAHGRSLPVIETYPRFVIKTLWPEQSIPSKRKEPKRYVAELWPRIRALGYESRRPVTHDEIDAMLCALAAEAFVEEAHVQVGAPLVVDEADGVLREGYIVAPHPRGRKPIDDEAEPLAAIQELSYERAADSLRSSWPPESAMDAAGLSAFLARKDYAVLATATPDGRPQAAPVAFFVQDGSFWIATVAGVRLRNLRAVPYASLVVAEGDRGDHRAVRVEGPVRLHDGPEPELESLRQAWQERHGSDPRWAAAFVELRPELLFSYKGA
jgi:predicted nuclease with RNAse H fold/nitroimidazol reductase NimA-like FMN-containing flavoprotein (pyridoxamine 5'-phosphate oxidase superfamily)